MSRVSRKHGLSYTPEYRAWQTMRVRCTNPQNAAWKDYGGRGITVCSRWMDDPIAFVSDMGPKPSPKHELDRIDNDGPYSPENCRWVLRTVNSRNRRSNRTVTHAGETLTVSEWAERMGIGVSALKYRLDAGSGLVVGVADIVAGQDGLAGQFASAGHRMHLRFVAGPYRTAAP